MRNLGVTGVQELQEFRMTQIQQLGTKQYSLLRARFASLNRPVRIQILELLNSCNSLNSYSYNVDR